jgi:uncharacterized protein YegL
MKSLKKGIISLLAFMMALTLTPSVFAATGDSDASGSDTKSVYTVKNPDPSSENGLYSSKTLTLNDDGTGTITLETYVTGSIVSTGTPTDVVLVLDVSQSMSQSMGSTTKLAALKSAVNTFIDTTAKKNESAKTDAQKSRISIVSFSGSATVVSDFSSDATTLKSAVTNLKQGQGTAADYAMTTAKSQLDKIDSTRKSNKVVIFFTDGEPNHGSNSFNATVANSAISTAKTIKASGATVYSIGVVSGADPSLDPTASSTSNINKFLHGVSSNYPDATAYTSLGTRAKDSAGKDLACYKSATNASELEKIFEDIGEAAVPSVELNTGSIVQDTMSEYLEFNGSVAGDVKVYTSKYTGKDADGNATFAERVAASDTIKTTVKDGTVQVTGFDFEPVIDKTATTYQGKKLIIEIPVKLADGAASMSGEELNSNDAASSGIYQKDSQTPVRSFGTPTATMPKAKITVTANDSEKTYDGTPLTDSSYTVDGTLVEGDVLTAVVEGSQTDAGSSANVVKSYKVMRGDKDVTDKYDISTKDGKLTVDKRAVTFTGESDTITYDRNNHTLTKITADNLVDGHTYEDLTYEASGTNAGTYKGEFTGDVKIMDGDTDVTDNYDVTKTPGKLKINPVEDKVVVTIVGEHATKEYSGGSYQVTGYKVTNISNSLYEESDCALVKEDAANATRTNVGTSNMELTADSFKNINDNFTNVEFQVTDGYLRITKRPVEIKVVSSEKLYGKDDPEFDDATMAGQVEGELTDIALAVSRTDAGKEGGEKLGKHEGVLQIANTKEELEDKYTNYTFIITNGDFTIKENGEDLKVKADDVEQVYNGNSITTVATAGLEGATIKYADEDGEYTLDTCPTFTDVGEKTVKFQATLEGYTPATGTATLKVTKRPVTITVGDAEKKYSDEDPAFEDAAMSGQVDGELKDIDLTVTRTDLEAEDGEELGLHEGVLQIAYTKDDLEKEYTNYTFTITNGNFTITENDVKLTVSAENVEQVYDGNSITTVATAGIEGATIKYMDDEGNYTLDECPTLTNVGEKTVKFQATAHGYKAATGEATLKVTKRPVTITVGDSGKLYGKDDPEFGDAELTNQIGKELDDISLKVTRTDADDEEKGEELGEHEGVLQIADTKEELEEKYTNYTFTIKNGDFTISTNNVDLKVDALDVTEVYSGKAISTTASAGIKGATIKYMDEEGNYTLDECPTLTDVGEKTVKFQATLKGYTDATGEAKLTVTPATLKVTTPSDSKVYDGTALTKEGSYEGLAEGETITFTTTGTRTNVGDVKNTYEIKWDGSAKKSNYNVVEESIGTLTVTKKPVTLTGESQTITYDGEEHTLTEIDAKDLVSGHKLEGLTYKATGTNAGDYNGEFSGTVKIMDGDKDVTDNYDVTKTPGKLTINPISEEVVVTIEGNKETKTYTGSEQSTTGYEITKITNKLYTAEDVELVGKAEANRTNVGTTIMDLGNENFKNTNTNFTNVKFDIWDGSITITKKAVTFTGESKEVTYNGAAQTIDGITDEGLVTGHKLEGLTYEATGTDAGDYDGEFTGTVKIKDGDEDVTDNYEITMTPGKLTINPVTDKVVVTIVGEHATKEYSGESYQVTGYEVTNISNPLYKDTDCALVKGDAANATRTDVGTSNMELTSKSFENKSDNFTNVEFQVTDGYITVTKKPVTIKVVDASKVYGNPDPEFADATMTGQVKEELKGVDLTVSRTDSTDNTLGEHKGVLQIKDTKESLEEEYTNYTFTITNGNFTISTNETGLKVSAPDVTKTYTGEAISTTASAGIKDATIKYMDEDGKYTLDECPTLTDVGTKTVKFQATAYGYKSVTGEAKLTVTPATLTVTTPDAEKVYDGEPLTKDGELTGLQNGETVTFITTGSQTKVGKSDNTYEIKWDGTAKEGNYTVEAEIGELEVTKAKVTPDTGDDNNVVLYGFMGLTALVAELFVVSRRRRSSKK